MPTERTIRQDKRIEEIVDYLSSKGTFDKQERDAVLAVSIVTILGKKQDFLKLGFKVGRFLERLSKKGYDWAITYLPTCKRFIIDKDFRERVLHYSDYIIFYSRFLAEL